MPVPLAHPSNEVFEDLRRVYLTSNKAEFETGLRAAAERSLEQGHTQDKSRKHLNQLVIGATHLMDSLSIAECMAYLDSPDISTRVIAALNFRSVVMNHVDCPLEQRGVLRRKAQKVLQDVIVEHPYLLDPKIRLRRKWTYQSHSFMTFLGETSGLLLPDDSAGYTHDELVKLACNRHVFEVLRDTPANRQYWDEIDNTLLITSLCSLHAKAKEGLQNGLGPKRISSSLLLDSWEFRARAGQRLGFMFHEMTAPCRPFDVDFTDGQAALERSMAMLLADRDGKVVKRHFLESFIAGFEESLQGVYRPREQAAEMAQGLLGLGVTQDGFETFNVLKRCVLLASKTGNRSSVTMRSGPEVIDFIEAASQACGVQAPWQDLVSVLDSEPQIGRPPVNEAEATIRAQAMAESMNMAIGHQAQVNTGSAVDPMWHRRRSL